MMLDVGRRWRKIQGELSVLPSLELSIEAPGHLN